MLSIWDTGEKRVKLKKKNYQVSLQPQEKQHWGRKWKRGNEYIPKKRKGGAN